MEGDLELRRRHMRCRDHILVVNGACIPSVRPSGRGRPYSRLSCIHAAQSMAKRPGFRHSGFSGTPISASACATACLTSPVCHVPGGRGNEIQASVVNTEGEHEDDKQQGEHEGAGAEIGGSTTENEEE